MVARNDIYWADLGPPAGRRPVCVLTRDAAIEVLNAVTCAPITRTVRSIRSEVELGPEHGLPDACVISCGNVISVPPSTTSTTNRSATSTRAPEPDSIKSCATSRTSCTEPDPRRDSGR